MISGKELAEKLRNLANQMPGGCEGLDEYLAETKDSDAVERAFYSLGYLDAIKALGHKKEVDYAPFSSVHDRLRNLIDTAQKE